MIDSMGKYVILSDDGYPSSAPMDIDELIATLKWWAESCDKGNWRVGEEVVVRRVE